MQMNAKRMYKLRKTIKFIKTSKKFLHIFEQDYKNLYPGVKLLTINGSRAFSKTELLNIISKHMKKIKHEPPKL